MAQVYGTVTAVRAATGVQPGDLNLDTEADLESLIEGWLEEATDLINHDRDRDFQAEADADVDTDVPPGIHGIANRMVSNLISNARQERLAAHMSHDEYTQNPSPDIVISEGIRADLDLYDRGTPYDPDVSPNDFGGIRFFVPNLEAVTLAEEWDP